MNIYINRDIIDDVILKIGSEEWKNFKSEPICKKGNQFRCNFVVGDDKAMLDFYFNVNGSTTIKATGKNINLSKRLAELLKRQGYENKRTNSTCTFNNIEQSYVDELINYLKTNKIKVIEEKIIENPKHIHYKLKSDLGDSLTINYYKNGKVLFQGKPAYTFSEAIYFMSLSSKISIIEIVEKNNETYNTNVTIDSVRKKLKQRIPHIYDKLDERMLKILSPTITLSEIDVEMDDYTCVVFPVLKGLEQLLLLLLQNKGIYKPEKDSFGMLFRMDKNTNKHILTTKNSQKVQDAEYAQIVENIYNYFRNNRHVYFHANQLLILTQIITEKSVADVIVNEVFELFNLVGKKNMM